MNFNEQIIANTFMSQHPSDDHFEEARLLLPWYITRRLPEMEKKLVEQVLEQRPELRQELQTEQALVELIRNNSHLLQLSAVDTTQQRLGKLLKRINQEETSKTDATTNTDSSSAWRSRISNWLKNIRTQWLNTGWLTPATAVFASLLIIQAGLLGVFVFSGAQKDTQSTAGMNYITATAPDTTVQPKASFLISFQQNASVSQLEAFLQKWHAVILDGPDDNRLFTVAIKDSAPVPADTSSMLNKIQQDQTVVESALLRSEL